MAIQKGSQLVAQIGVQQVARGQVDRHAHAQRTRLGLRLPACGGFEDPQCELAHKARLLGEGDELTDTFEVTVTDEDGLTDTVTVTLTITGNGAMPNYDYGAAPWQEYQEGIETVNVGSGVTSIGSNAFCNCIYMTTLSLPAGMETIGDNAFSYCLSITSAELPGTITKIGESAFEGCTSLESIALPEELETIGGFAFADCVALASVDFPSYLTYIGRWSFSGCEALGEVSIPASVETISDNAFASCVNLSSVQLSEGLKSIEETAWSRWAKISLASGMVATYSSTSLSCSRSLIAR